MHGPLVAVWLACSAALLGAQAYLGSAPTLPVAAAALLAAEFGVMYGAMAQLGEPRSSPPSNGGPASGRRRQRSPLAAPELAACPACCHRRACQVGEPCVHGGQWTADAQHASEATTNRTQPASTIARRRARLCLPCSQTIAGRGSERRVPAPLVPPSPHTHRPPPTHATPHNATPRRCAPRPTNPAAAPPADDDDAPQAAAQARWRRWHALAACAFDGAVLVLAAVALFLGSPGERAMTPHAPARGLRRSAARTSPRRCVRAQPVGRALHAAGRAPAVWAPCRAAIGATGAGRLGLLVACQGQAQAGERT